MMAPFHVAAGIAVIATVAVLCARNAVHGLLYFIVSLLAVASIFFLIGAPFAAALQIIIYAGAIMVLFVFGVMVLGLGEEAMAQERRWLRPPAFIVPVLISALLVLVLWRATTSMASIPRGTVGPREVGEALFVRHLLGLELASVVLLAGLIAAFHLGRRQDRP
jgi:NADH-quinone oxidoreductase subunit J